jgi:hypothetical protein
MTDANRAGSDAARFDHFLADWRAVLALRATVAAEALAAVDGVAGLVLAGSVGRGDPWPTPGPHRDALLPCPSSRGRGEVAGTARCGTDSVEALWRRRCSARATRGQGSRLSARVARGQGSQFSAPVARGQGSQFSARVARARGIRHRGEDGDRGATDGRRPRRPARGSAAGRRLARVAGAVSSPTGGDGRPVASGWPARSATVGGATTPVRARMPVSPGPSAHAPSAGFPEPSSYAPSAGFPEPSSYAPSAGSPGPSSRAPSAAVAVW